jgi:putative membrane protein
VEKNEIRNDSGAQRKKLPHRVVLQWLLRVIQGAIIGAGAILPGISGGVLCVVFGIYQPMMALLAHPIRAFKKHFKLLLPVLIGWALGFWGLASLVSLLLEESSSTAIWLFIGLIAGMTPSLFKEAGRDGRPKSAWISLAISTAVILALLLYVHNATGLSIQPNMWWFLFCGALWGISLVVPGLSSSSLLIFLGLYGPMTDGIHALSLEVVIPLLVGVAAVTLLSARGINYLFKKHYAMAYHMVLGFVLASTVMIIPAQYENLTEILLCAVCFVGGFAAAWLMDRAGKKIHTTAKQQ